MPSSKNGEQPKFPEATGEKDAEFMKMAIREARAAMEMDEVPVGCIIVRHGKVIGRAHNQREMLRDPTAHAEMIAITQAASACESWRVTDATCFVTLEPCPMCAGALVLARVNRVVYGAMDPKAGACDSLYDIPRDGRLNHRIDVVGGVLEDECGALLSEFFASKRIK